MGIEVYLMAVIVCLILFSCWREWHNSKLVNKLTDKLMSRDFTEYSMMSPDKQQSGITTRQTPDNGTNKVNDPVLGGNF